MNKFHLLIFTLCFCPICYAEIIQDEIANKLPKYIQKPKINNNYNFESTVKLPVRMRILEEVHCEKDVYEGQILKFRVTKAVYHNSENLIPENSIITARVKAIITSGMNGIPASIILDDFNINNLKKGQFANNIEIFGQDRSLIVFPLKWVLTVIPPTGSLTNLIRGGHAKIKTKKTIILDYYPEWT